ncbi:putative reverse transcriptase domain-containing protein [Tanacetum coccineum]
MPRDVDQRMEKKKVGGLYFIDIICVPLIGDVSTIIIDEARAMRYAVHPRADKMYYDLRDMYWWSGMKKDIATYVSKCLTCSKIEELAPSVHDTFHMSNLKKCLADANLHVLLEEIKVDKTLHFVEEPIEITDRED